MIAESKPTSPFFNAEISVFGHNPFEYKGDMYRFNPTVSTVKEVSNLLPSEDKAGLHKKFWLFPEQKPVIVGIIDRVFDDPLIDIKPAPGAKKEAKEFNDMLVEMNGIQFHRQYYNFMGGKKMFEGLVKLMANGKKPDELNINDFLYLFCINFFAKDLIGAEELNEKRKNQIQFFKKVLEDMNAFEYVFLGHAFPEDRTNMHFLLWEK